VKRRFAWLALVAIALGLAVLAYRGPARPIVRGHVGDVAATMLVYALVGMLWRAGISARAVVTIAIATVIEVGQRWWRLESRAGELLLGTTFDGLDLVAYVAGVGVAVAWELAPLRGAEARDVTTR